MSTVVLEQPRLVPSPAASVRQLGVIEAKRYAKHRSATLRTAHDMAALRC